MRTLMMMLKVWVTVTLLQVGSGAEFDWCSLTCDGGTQHTMCIYKEGGGDSCKEVKRGLTAEEKDVILDYHNQLRAKVANGKETTGPQPSATDMNQLVWDDEVAQIAQRWVDQCEQPGGHDKCRITKDKEKVGQNYAESSGSGMAVDRISMMKELVQSWYDEVKDMDPSLVKAIQFKGPVIGHYTQVVWGKTTRVGCGLAHKQEKEDGEFEIRLICNYKPAGNFLGQPVYTEGEPASKCVKKSGKYEGLCETQEEGDKIESDDSASSSSTDSPTHDSSSDASASSSSTDTPIHDSSADASASSSTPDASALESSPDTSVADSSLDDYSSSSSTDNPTHDSSAEASASSNTPDADAQASPTYDSNPASSQGTSPFPDVSHGFPKPFAFASTAFGKPVSFASAGGPMSFSSAGFPSSFGSPFPSSFASTGAHANMASGVPTVFASPPSTTDIHQFIQSMLGRPTKPFSSLALPSRPDKAQAKKPPSFFSSPMSSLDIDKFFRMFGKKSNH